MIKKLIKALKEMQKASSIKQAMIEREMKLIELGK